MPKYLFTAKYTQHGVEGLVTKGAASRVDAVRSMTESGGGTLESLHFAFGGTDLYAIADMPDDEAAAAVSLTVAAAGGASPEVVKLLTPEQLDAAIGRTIAYRPPGS